MSLFDPYLNWFKIPPDEQPPNHYRLLGLPLFESDAAKVREAADKRLRFLERQTTGPHAEPARKLSNEVLAARICLLQDESRHAYDKELRAARQRRVLPSAMNSAPVRSPARRAAPWLVAAGGILALAAVGISLLLARKPSEFQPANVVAAEETSTTTQPGSDIPVPQSPAPSAPADEASPAVTADTKPAPAEVAINAGKDKDETPARPNAPPANDGPAPPIPPVAASQPSNTSAVPAGRPEGYIAELIQAKHAPVDLRKDAVAFDGPRGNGRSGALGALIPKDPKMAAGTQWKLFFQRDGHARGVQLIHPHRDGHVLVQVLQEGVHLFPGGPWPESVYMQSSKYPFLSTAAFQEFFPLDPQTEREIQSILDADGNYALLIDQRLVLTARFDTVAPLSRIQMFNIPGTPEVWPAGAGGIVLGPLDDGFNRARKVYFLPFSGTAPDPDQKSGPTESTPVVEVVREAVPGPEAQDKTRGEVRSIFEKEYAAARSPAEKLALAQKLLEQALETKEDPVARYVLLDESRALAVDAGEPADALRALEEMLAEFEMDDKALSETIGQLSRSTRSVPGWSALAEAAMDHSGRVAENEQFETALELAGYAVTAAVKSREAELRRTTREFQDEMEAMHGSWKAAEEAQETLKSRPDDGDAHLALGAYLVFVRADWEAGLPHLSQSSDAGLKEAALRELAKLSDSASAVEVGDLWIKAAKNLAAPQQRLARDRARTLYEQALPELTGLTKARVEKVLEEIEKERASAERISKRLGGSTRFGIQWQPVPADGVPPSCFTLGPFPRGTSEALVLNFLARARPNEKFLGKTLTKARVHKSDAGNRYLGPLEQKTEMYYVFHLKIDRPQLVNIAAQTFTTWDHSTVQVFLNFRPVAPQVQLRLPKGVHVVVVKQNHDHSDAPDRSWITFSITGAEILHGQ